MYDADAIEAINFEQLVTVTDRLLLRRGRVSKRRPSTARIGPPLDESERTVIIHRPAKRAAVDATVVLSSAILTILAFIAVLA